VDGTGDRHWDGSDIERYEMLRRKALGGEEAGWRLGLAVLVRQGLAAWLRVGDALPAPPPNRPPGPAPVCGDELVGVLATMALACLDGR
jgi:hypothetical protein